MLSKTIGLSLAACALLAGCAGSETRPPPPADSATAQQAKDAQAEAIAAAAGDRRIVKVVDDSGRDPDAMRCKRIAKTGSRVEKKVCATNREWAMSERRGQEMTEDYQRNSSYGREIDNRGN